MAYSVKGSCLVLSLVFSLSCSSLSSVDCCPDSLETFRFQIQKLEELVRNLSEITHRLESRFNHPVGKIVSDEVAREAVEKEVEEEEDDDGGNREPASAISVMRHHSLWMDRFQFISEVRLRSGVTSVDVLPFRDYDGAGKYVAVGDDLGRLYLFFRNGDFAAEHRTFSSSAITVLLSYLSAYKNETRLITGHRNGDIFIHRIWEKSTGEEPNYLELQSVGKFDPGKKIEEEGEAVRILELHNMGRTKYVISSNERGRISVFRENGSVLHGSVTPASKPLAFLKQRLLFLTEKGAGSLDLRTMKIKESECEGLNRSTVTSYAFDATERSRSKAYGFTSSGELIHVLLMGDHMNFKCRVRTRRNVGEDKLLSHHIIRGYLLVASEDAISVYNVSMPSQHYSRVIPPRLLFTTPLRETGSPFLSSPRYRGGGTPLMASDREKLVVLSRGDGSVAVYRSNLPLFEGESGMMLWTSPVLFFLLFFFGAWYFIARKKEVLTSWGPDDPFVSGGPAVDAVSGDRAFANSSIKGGAGQRGCRYASPPAFPVTASSSFRSNAGDLHFRATPARADLGVRAPSELKFRGLNLDSSAFSLRRPSFLGVDEALHSGI